MTPGITLITPTGGRSESFARCTAFVQRFIKPDKVHIQWIIIDDCDEIGKSLYVSGVRCMHVIPQHRWFPGRNTLGQNLLEVVPYVEHDCILFIEDDDWYAPEYLKSMYESLQTADIIGEVPARYYHVPSKQYSLQENKKHASLCQTGIRRSMLTSLEEICRSQNSEFIDVRLWKVPSNQKFLETTFCVGMKGLPGRPGIGIGHRPDHYSRMWNKDSDLTVLRRWIGDDVKMYPI